MQSNKPKFKAEFIKQPYSWTLRLVKFIESTPKGILIFEF